MKDDYRPHDGAKYVPIGRRHVIKVPATCTLSKLDDEVEGVTRIDLDIDLVGDVLGVVAVTVTASDDHEVTGTTLRAVAVNSLMRHAVAGAMLPMEQQGGFAKIAHLAERESWGFSDEDRARFRSLGPVAETLKAVADVYEFGKITGRPPAREVEIQLDLPRTTASKWVRRARDEGYLGG
ncbi:MAG: hypothetical protein ACTHU1_05650 [Arachnia sp.]